MKEQLSGNPNRGVSTLEILIAFTVLTLSVVAVSMIVLGNQSVAIDTQTNIEGLGKAQAQLEQARALSRQNFSSVVTIPEYPWTPPGGLTYYASTTVGDLTQCKKQATSTVEWSDQGRPQKIELSTFLSDIAGVFNLGGDCAVDPTGGGWTHPRSLMSRELKKDLSLGDNPLVNSPAGTPATDVDVLHDMIYMTAMSNKDDFFVLDGGHIMGLVIPPIVGSLKIGSGIGNWPGLNEVDVAGKYAYIANASSTDDKSSDELIVVDTTLPLNAASIVKRVTLGITPNCAAHPPVYCPGGARTVHYYNGRVYVGTHRIGGHDFYVYSVTTPYTPNDPHLLGSIKLDHNVNAIVVRDQMVGGVLKTIAYLATSGDTKEVIVLDATNPSLGITEIGAFDAKSSDGAASDMDGTKIFLIGNKLYLGREKVDKNDSKQRDFYVIDISNSAIPSPSPLGSANLQYVTEKNFSANTVVSGVYVTGKYAFVSTNDADPGFIVLDISKPASLNIPVSDTLHTSVISTFNYANYNAGIDFENGFIYTANSQNHALRIIRPAQCADKIDNDSDGKIDLLDPQCHRIDGSYDPEDDSE